MNHYPSSSARTNQSDANGQGKNRLSTDYRPKFASNKKSQNSVLKTEQLQTVDDFIRKSGTSFEEELDNIDDYNLK